MLERNLNQKVNHQKSPTVKKQLNHHRLFLIALTVLTVLTLATIYQKNKLKNDQHALIDTQQAVKKQTDNNNDLKQTIAELSTESRLKAIAQENGLSINNNQIKDVKPSQP